MTPNLIPIFFKNSLAPNENDPTPSGGPAIGGKSLSTFQTWYGRVNKWRTSRSILDQEIAKFVQCGVSGYMIELSVSGKKDMWSNDGLKSLENDYKYLLDLCRRNGIWLFVSVVNDNMGRGKYGDTGPALKDVYDWALKLLDMILRNGKNNVIIQPVAETQTDKGKQFETDTKSILNDFPLVYNGYESGKKGMNYKAIHPSHVDTKVASDCFAVSDNGSIILEFINGGKNLDKNKASTTFDKFANTEKVKEWKKNIKNCGCKVCGYYAFQTSGFDRGTIETLGEK